MVCLLVLWSLRPCELRGPRQTFEIARCCRLLSDQSNPPVFGLQAREKQGKEEGKKREKMEEEKIRY